MVVPPSPEPVVAVVDSRRSPHSRLRPLSMTDVRLGDRFWAPRRERNRAVTLPEQYRQCAATGRLDNFRRASGRWSGSFRGKFYNDSDVYKWLEAAAWTLASDDDPALRAQVDEVVGLIAAAQDADGYLNTYFSLDRATERWTDLRVKHELYCAGHLFQAAVAHHRAIGSRDLLDVAVRLADHIAATFGPDKRPGADGHPEIEMALVELSRETGEGRYVGLARFFVDQRGQRPSALIGTGERTPDYYQDHLPVREQREAVGHAVRALYLYGGMTDLYAETGEGVLREAVDALWHDLQARRTYITGGVGARYEGEAIGADYELPNARAYAETCASIASVMWNWRLLLLTGEARFADALEAALYNGTLAGLALDGRTYFYQNPLADRGGHRRQPWFGTACCPPNIARLLASLPGYLVTTSNEGVWLHLYAASRATAELPGAGTVTLTQRTDYPWDGAIEVAVRPAAPATFSLFLRVPGWVAGQGRPTLQVNGVAHEDPLVPGEYVEIRREWAIGDTVRLLLPMGVRPMASHPHVTENRGRVALTRGPLVYCLEGVDHPGVDLWDLALPAGTAWEWESEWQPELLDGVVVLRAAGHVPDPTASGPSPLYRPYDPRPVRYRDTPLTAIPYYAWGNRAPGPMQVWLPVA